MWLAGSGSRAVVLALAGALTSGGACGRPAGPRGRVEERRFHSTALGEDRTYLVWLPPRYAENDRRYPAVYLLHGFGGDQRDAVADAHAPETADRLGLE